MNDLSPLGRAALEYAARGWHVFPLKHDSKVPLVPILRGGKGHKDATTDAAKIERWWRITPDANIGLNLIWSGLVCVDADTYDPTCGWSHFAAGQEIPDTLIQRSARGGTHYIFASPPGVHFAGKLAKRVDIKHDGYILLSPSTFEGGPYQWQTDDDPTPIPEWLQPRPEVQRAEGVASAGARLATDPKTRAYCDAAITDELARIAGAVDGERNQCLNQAAFSIGQIVGAGLADRDDMVSALRDAVSHWPNQRKNDGVIESALNSGAQTPRDFPMDGEPPYDHDEVAAMVQRIKEAFDRRDNEAVHQIVAEAMAPPGPVRDIFPDMPRFSAPTPRAKAVRLVMTASEYEAILPTDPGPFPILNFASDMPGLLGMVADYLDRASSTATEAGGLAVALPLLGAVMGRAYASPSDLRTNIYTVALGGSGTGKTSLVNPAKELLTLARATHLIGNDDIKSGSGLMKMLTGLHPKVSFLDEFGHMLQQITSFSSGAHAKEILTTFTRLYSSANTLYTGAAMVSQAAAPIDCPHLCLFGMATPDQFWDAFGSSSLADGTVARYLVIPIGESAPKDPDKTNSASVAEALNDVVASIEGRNRYSLTPVCKVSTISAEADRADKSLRESMDAAAAYADEAGIRGASSILRRVAENAIKIALVSAVGRDHGSPEINAHDHAIGHAIARWSATVMISNIASRIADNNFERSLNKVERRIIEAGADGILRGTLVKSVKMEPREMNNILAVLEESNMIVKEATKSAKPGYRFTHINHLKGKSDANL